MSKHKIAFLDLPFHRKTRSSSFFVELLSEEFEVDVFYVDTDPRATLQELAQSSYETIICWQTEFAAPYFLLVGKRVVCVPMYDGVATAPDWYWTAMAQARFVCFSTTLHNRLKRLGLDSLSVQYFQGAGDTKAQSKFETLNGFFWQRRPEEGLDHRFVQKLIGRVVQRLHIHNAPDTENARDWTPSGDVSVSHFTESGDEYKAALTASNIYVAPRMTEGIGHTITEAMSRGMCVVAHDEVTANEYIVDGVNGILIDYGNPPQFVRYPERTAVEKEIVLTPAKANRLGESARRSFEKGLETWTQARHAVLYYVLTTPKADFGPNSNEFVQKYLALTKYARSDFGLFLARLASFLRSGYDPREYATVSFLEALSFRFRALPGVQNLARIAKKVLTFRR
ncbi:glycosyltransferase [Maritalea porphyrae]|uniref:Glycosyl transferase family 1 domain-containing protein n=1 Tax=Maritalea porphyrae TaxID=880732 RepID=A0ABQ5UVS5_9HYPH|nr:glycosyltransferase [Maritalea porphyrae]GLQ18653.1 hypothetical protein GCM10007879_29020 [Maritalea porphyrae]